MFLKFTYFFLFAALLPLSYGHAVVSPQLGVNRVSERNDVKQPSNGQPCGNGVDIPGGLNNSPAVQATADGQVSVTVTSFNADRDGSRNVRAKVDPSGKGNTFINMKVLMNGNGNPDGAGSEQVVAQLPEGTKCTGGSNKNRCLVQFITTGNFGNCVVVSQGSGSPDVGAADPGVGGNNVPNQGEKTGGNEGNGKDQGGKNNGGNQAGTRAPRALLADLERGS